MYGCISNRYYLYINIDICVPSLLCLWFATSTETFTKYKYNSEITINAPSNTCQSLGVYTF